MLLMIMLIWLIERHMKATQRIRSLANFNSKTTARKMVLSGNTANPPTQYKIGCEVLVRRFSTIISKKKDGKGLARKMSRVVEGTVTDIKATSNQYKVRWYSVSDITSLTREEENKRQRRCKLIKLHQ